MTKRLLIFIKKLNQVGMVGMPSSKKRNQKTLFLINLEEEVTYSNFKFFNWNDYCLCCPYLQQGIGFMETQLLQLFVLLVAIAGTFFLIQIWGKLKDVKLN